MNCKLRTGGKAGARNLAHRRNTAGKTPYFYTHYSEKHHRNDIEIDFLLSQGTKTAPTIIPVEVKSSQNYSTTSYDAFKKRFKRHIGQSIIVHPKGFSQDEKGLRLPSYMFSLLFNSEGTAHLDFATNCLS